MGRWPDLGGQAGGEGAEPYGWWGYAWQEPELLSIVELIARGALDARTAAILWLMIERRASVLVAAEPPGAGKTTTLTALADFLPPDVARFYLRGWSETFAFLGTADPARSYLLCNEISPHLPVYLWGRKVSQLFAAVAEGYGLGATLHADSLDEVVALLEGYPLAVPRRALARVDLLLTLAVDYVERRPRRRLEALTLLRRDGRGDDLDPAVLARWDPATGAITHAAGPAPAGLAARVGLPPPALAGEWERRAAFLADLLARDVRARPEVRRALAAYDAGTSGPAGPG